MATYNLINSVKGGCGKTTFSIWLAEYLGRENSELTLLVDLDLLGTSMQVIFYGHNKQNLLCINEIFNGVNDHQDYVQRLELKNGDKLNVIFSSMDVKDKNKFKSGKNSGYSPVVKHGVFRIGMQKLIKANQYIDNNDVKHFILDMPPNSDGFSDTAMDCVMNRKYKTLKDGDRKNLFLMVGSDMGQTIATISLLQSLLTRTNSLLPSRIFIVFNDNISINMGNKDYELRRSILKEAIEKEQLKQEELKNIYFLIMCSHKMYTQKLVDGQALCDLEAEDANNVFTHTVIEAWSGYDDEEFTTIDPIQGDGEITLRKLIKGE